MEGWLQVLILGAGIFKDERAEHFRNRGKKLLKKIEEVEDTDFYHKDMNGKGKAERELMKESEKLRNEYIKEAASL